MSEVPSTLWASIPVPAFLVAENGAIANVNPAAEMFANESSKALIGTPMLDRLAIDAPVEKAIARVRSRRSPYFINNVNVTCGQSPPLECNIQIASIQGNSTDILFLFVPRQFAERSDKNYVAGTSAQSAIGMADMLAHEIKNPLAGITGAAQLLSMNLAPQDREMTELIVEECRRIVALLDRVEQLGHAETPNRSAINVHGILDRARKSASLGYAAAMRWREEFDPSLPETYADGDQIMQVFLNLFKNAAEAAGEEGGEIVIRTYFDLSQKLRRTDGGGRALPLQIEIIDDGPGLPDEISANIFEPFVSGRKNGSGLGLALVSRIISAHGGWIDFESVPGRTIFKISLPMATEQESEQI